MGVSVSVATQTAASPNDWFQEKPTPTGRWCEGISCPAVLALHSADWTNKGDTCVHTCTYM